MICLFGFLAVQDSRVPLERVNDFTYWLQEIDLAKLRESRFDLCIIDHARDGKEFSSEEIGSLRKTKIALSYFSVGEAEDYRTYWRESWKSKPPPWLGPENPDWKGNYKVRFWHDEWQKIIFEYLDRILEQGFDGAYLDVIDSYSFWKERARMIQFVRKISEYAKRKKKDFAVFVQNAEELLEDDAYLAAIDGIGREETYYQDGRKNGDAGDVERCLDRAVRAKKKVLIVEYVEGDAADGVYARAKLKGYVAYATRRKLDRLVIPKGHEPD